MGILASTRRLVRLALAEDLGPGDVTSEILSSTQLGRATILAKGDLVLAGREVAEEVFRQVDASVTTTFVRSDGDVVKRADVVAHIAGPARAILGAERTALNFLQRLSGIATLTYLAVQEVRGTKTRILDTRKTTPGWRVLEKAAVRAGGGTNHRFGLFDGVLIKDNHIVAAGGIGPAIAYARKLAHPLLRIECEVEDLAGLEEALASGADMILLDNMSTVDIRRAVARAAGRVPLEASGSMTLERLGEVAQTGVDFISMGSLTHSAPAADLSLDFST